MESSENQTVTASAATESDASPTAIRHAENKMGTMPVPRLLVSMSLPMVVSMLVQALYNVVDSIFVSKYDQAAMTAVTEDARPSRPSVKFAPFTVPRTARNKSGSARIPGSTVSPPVKGMMISRLTPATLVI